MSEIVPPFSDAQRAIVEQWAKRHRVTPGELCQAFVMMYLEAMDSHIDAFGQIQCADDILSGIESYVDHGALPEWLTQSE